MSGREWFDGLQESAWPLSLLCVLLMAGSEWLAPSLTILPLLLFASAVAFFLLGLARLARYVAHDPALASNERLLAAVAAIIIILFPGRRLAWALTNWELLGDTGSPWFAEAPAWRDGAAWGVELVLQASLLMLTIWAGLAIMMRFRNQPGTQHVLATFLLSFGAWWLSLPTIHVAATNTGEPLLWALPAAFLAMVSGAAILLVDLVLERMPRLGAREQGSQAATSD